MISMALRRFLVVAATAGLAIIALSVVIGALVEARGPRADRLSEVTLATPMDVGVIVAEVTSSSAPAVSSTAEPTTTTVTIVVAAAGPPRRSSSAGAGDTRSLASTGGSASTAPRPAVANLPEPPTTVRSGTTRSVSTATTVPRAKESTKTKTDTHTTTTSVPDSSSTTTDHEVAPPTVREDHDDDH